MIKNYFIVAFRNLWKNKVSSVINISGLTIGLTSCLLIACYIRHEVSYDSFQKNGKRIARVIMEYRFDGGGESNKGNFTSVRVASVFKKNFPEVESAVKMTEQQNIVRHGNKLIDEKRFMYADSGFFSVFSFKLLQGDQYKVLAAPKDLVLTASTAKKYFGNEDPVGKSLTVGTDNDLYLITGVMQDCPSNSQIKFDFLASFSSLGIGKEYEATYWDANYTTYLLLENESSRLSLQKKIPSFMKKEMEGQGATVNFFLEPFDKIHLHSEFDGFEPNNSIGFIYILAAVALLILIIACSTYINLCTARSMERAREVGVRKVIGADKNQLFWQFIGESGVLCLISVAFSLLLAAWLMPYFNQLTEKQLQWKELFSFLFLGFSFLIAILVSLVAGSYPALILTRFQPVKVLKGSFRNTGSGQWLRKALIIFQFAISLFLIVSTLIIQKQLYYIQHKKLGYEKERVLVLPMENKMLGSLSLIKQEFKSDPDIINISRCVSTPVTIGGGYNMRSALMPAGQQFAVTGNPVDEDFVKTTGLEMIAGNDFTEQDIKDVASDSQSKRIYHFILNESAARQLGWTPEAAVGKKMFLDESRPGFVKGVIKDFHFESLHKAIRPLVLFPELRGRQLLVKLSGHNLPQALAFLQTKWKTLVPGRPFEYHFLDEDFDQLYKAEIRLGEVMDLFSFIAITLACLGLFGLSSYMAQQRTKEIGVRKVLGASLGHIVVILSRDFVKLAAIALLIAYPVSWWATTKWLQDFAYKAAAGWTIYLVSGFAVLALVILTVGFRAIKAGLSNPVNSLRSE